MTSDSSAPKVGLFRRFPNVFWIVQIFELMERGAYYLMMPVLVVHAIDNVGVPEGLALVLAMFMYPLQYGIPIFSGALAEKWGYRKQMIFAFSVLSSAYIFLSFASNWIMMIIGVMLVGFGIGSYKPLISATVAKCTSDKDRNFAYSIYYWTVNLAAAVFPIIWTILRVNGVVNESMYSYVFLVGGIFLAVNIFVGIFVFREVPRSGKVKTAADAINNVRIAFKDRKFVVMVILIGGFWALYSSMLNVLPVAILKFDFPTPDWVDAMMIGIFNPFTIIALGIPLAKLVERLLSLKALIGGVILYIFGLTIICFSLQNFYLIIFGIIIASIGEFMVAPGYLAFVSKLAPKEKVSAYIGANFLATMLGLVGGTFVFGSLFNIIGIQMEMPRFFYGILITFGLVLLIAFVTYYKAWGKDIIDRARRIKEMEEGPLEEEVERPKTWYMKPFDAIDFRVFRLLPVVLIPIVLFATFSYGSNIYSPDDDETKYDIIWEGNSISYQASEFVEEGSDYRFQFEVPMMSTWINGSLDWSDTVPRIPLQNEPDSFSISLLDPEGQEMESDGPSENGLSFNHQLTYQRDEGGNIIEVNNTGNWTVVVRCNVAGDITGFFGIVTRAEDDGNEVDLGVRVEYIEKKRVERSEA
ncbi:MAG: MFS transporter [Thermoplasmatota archaeon]